jgi:hypothetical protein
MSQPSRSVTPNWYNTTIPNQPAVEPKQPHHLSRCYENITLKALKHQKNLSTLNKIAGWAASVIYVASVISSLVLSAIFSPALMPLTVLAAYSSAPHSIAFIKNRLAIAKDSQEVAKTIVSMRSYLESEDFPKTAKQIQDYVAQHNIDAGNINNENLDHIRSLIAHREHWQTQAVSLSEKNEAKFQELNKHKFEHPSETHQIHAIELEIIALEEAAILAKINAAFYENLLACPTYAYERDDIVQFNNVMGLTPGESPITTLGKRFLDSRFNRQSTHIVSFTNAITGEVQNFNREDLVNSNTSAIARMFLWASTVQ